jgi:hypothetical protein
MIRRIGALVVNLSSDEFFGKDRFGVSMRVPVGQFADKPVSHSSIKLWGLIIHRFHVTVLTTSLFRFLFRQFEQASSNPAPSLVLNDGDDIHFHPTKSSLGNQTANKRSTIVASDNIQRNGGIL